MSLADRDRLATGLERVAALPVAVRVRRAIDLRHLLRAGALLSALVLIASFTLVLRDIVGTVSDPTGVTVVVVGTVLAATVAWRVVTVRGAMRASGVAFAVALLLYGLSVPFAVRPSLALQGTAELLSGRSALWIVRVELWALLVAPVPVFLTWVLALERQYVRAAAAGGAALCFFVLTGDASVTVTVLGVAAAGALVGLGDVMSRADSPVTVEHLVIVLGIMVVAPFVFSVVPGGAAGPLGLVGSDTTTMEENVVGSGGSLDIVGSVDQDPEIRFLVSGDQPQYWRTESYDRYTGDGWVQSGESQPYDEGALEPPAEHTQVHTYEVTAQTTMGVLPAPWRPVGVDGVDDRATIAPDGTPTLDGTLDSGETVTVESASPEASPAALAAADGPYPDHITERYTQLPTSTPDRVEQRTRNIAANAETPYETAVVVEEWLRTNREYSLDVERPDGDIVDAFLFEMEEGYCTYYATAMVGMLRSVDIPTRLAVGYSPGEQLGDDTWAVRGTNSHAWVEVYIPEYGWVQFDPTPPDPRSETEAAAIAGPTSSTNIDVTVGDDSDADGIDAEDEAVDNIEPGDPLGERDPTEETRAPVERAIEEFNDPDGEPRSSGDDTSETDDDALDSGNDTADGLDEESDGTDGTDSDESGDGGLSVDPGDIDPSEGETALFSLPAYQQLLLGLLAVAGLAVGVRRSPVPDLVGRELQIRFQRRHDPATDIERAHERLLLVLEKRHRPRDPGETTRQYLDAVDACPEAHRLGAIRERARYAGESSAGAADEAVELVEAVRKQ